MRNIQGQNNAIPDQAFTPPQQTQIIAPVSDQSIMPSTSTTFNPGVKTTGAPVPFSPKAQNNMTGMFGNPVQGSYDRSMGNGFNPPIPTIAPIVPVDNLYNT